jgi:hypothetical protein
MSNRHETVPYGRADDRQPDLIGAAKQQHEAKLASEGGEQPTDELDEYQLRKEERKPDHGNHHSPSPYSGSTYRQLKKNYNEHILPK